MVGMHLKLKEVTSIRNYKTEQVLPVSFKAGFFGFMENIVGEQNVFQLKTMYRGSKISQ
jgi:hypothetical protein